MGQGIVFNVHHLHRCSSASTYGLNWNPVRPRVSYFFWVPAIQERIFEEVWREMKGFQLSLGNTPQQQEC